MYICRSWDVGLRICGRFLSIENVCEKKYFLIRGNICFDCHLCIGTNVNTMKNLSFLYLSAILLFVLSVSTGCAHKTADSCAVVSFQKEGDELCRAEKIRSSLMGRGDQHVLVVSHRAHWRDYPENSLEAIESAIALGVDIVEIDLQCTQDSQLIVMHDSRIDRTTTGKGKVAEMTLDSIRMFRLKNACAIRTPYMIPTLREVLLLCKGRVLLNLDKADRYFDLVMPLLEETGTTRQVIMKGRRTADEVKQLYGEYINKVIYMPIVDANDSSSLVLFAEHLRAHPCAIEVCYREDEQYIKEMRKMAGDSTLLWVNTLWDSLCGGHDDDKAYIAPDAHYGYLTDSLGIRIIQTDRPAFLIEWLEKHNKR